MTKENIQILKLKNYAFPIIWGLIILALSISPTVQLPETFFSPDKLGHIIFYGILAWLTLKAKKSEEKLSEKSAYFLTFICAFYGFLIESVQFVFFPNRYFEIGDIIANIFGCLLAKILFDKFAN